MRFLTDHIVNPCNDQLKIVVVDEPGSGGANHKYAIEIPAKDEGDQGFRDEETGKWMDVCMIRFQNGPINEVGVNGVTHEALLAILCDRLRGFQKGPYACRENAIVLTHLEEAQMWLQKRTRDRMARGVEGTHEK